MSWYPAFLAMTKRHGAVWNKEEVRGIPEDYLFAPPVLGRCKIASSSSTLFYIKNAPSMKLE
jgi:hypothetical protein